MGTLPDRRPGSRRLRINFVLIDANMSGGTRVIAIYAERLTRRGHTVTVTTPPRRKPTLRATLRGMLRGRRPQRWASHPPSFFDDCEVQLNRLDRFRPVEAGDIPDADVTIATWWETAPWVAALPASKGAKAYFMQDYGGEGMPMHRLVPTWFLPLRIITIAPWMQRLVQCFAPGTPVDVVPNAVDLGMFQMGRRTKPRCPTVGLVFARNPTKGVAEALRAFEIARVRIPELRLVGFGAHWGVGRPLPAGVEVRQNVPDASLQEIYGACDAWLFPSLLEGFGLPILEAMACRTPVIATPAGAAPELLAGGGGVLVRHGHPQEMADAMIRIVQMPEDAWGRMSETAYKTVSSYTWDDATERFEQSLLRAIDQPDAQGLRSGFDPMS